MKTNSILAMAALGVVNLAAAQSYPEGFPECGVTCIDNMLDKAKELGCSSDQDTACLCSNQNWVWGVRDCSNQACGDGNASTVQDYAASYCADASVPITYDGATPSATTIPGSSGSAAGTTTGAASLSTVTSEGTTFTSTVASSTDGSKATSTSPNTPVATTTDGGESANSGARLSAPAGLVAAAGAAVLFL